MVLTKSFKTTTQSGFSKEGKTGKRDGVMDRLQVQFAYFWKETLAALGDAGVPVPLDMLEDRSSRIFNFVENRCPQLLFELINANPDCRLVTRCAMSLIIVTIAILKKKVIPDPDSRRSLLYPEVENLERNETGYNDLDRDMSKWADLSLHQIADNAYISILVNMLQDTHEDVSIELTLFVIESMVTFSAEAAMCLLKAPYNPKNEARLRLEEEQAEKDIKAGKRGKYSPKPSPSSICNIITAVGAHRNREAMAGSLAHIITAIVKFTPAEHQDEVAANIARSTVPLELPLGQKKHHHHHHTPSSGLAASSSTASSANASAANNSPTLRRMAAARAKGSPEHAFEKALKGFSKVSKKMAYDQFGGVLNGLDPLASTRSKKATKRGGGGAHAGATGGGGGGGAKTGAGKGGAVAASPVPESTPGLTGATKAKQKDWVGLRMILRFLGRYSLYVDGALLNKDGYNDPSMTTAQKKFRKTEMSEAEENYVTARNSHQGRQLDDAHGKIIRALCCLIYASDDVAREVRKFRRLDRLLESSVKPHNGNALIMEDLVCARAAIKDVAEMDRLRQLQLHHPYSYSQTLGPRGVAGSDSVTGSMESVTSPKSAMRGGSSKSVRDEAKAVLAFADEADEIGSGSNQGQGNGKGTTYAFDRMGSLDTRSTQLSSKDGGPSNMSAVLSEKLEPLHTRPSTAPAPMGASQSLSLGVDSIVSAASSRPRSPGENVVRNGRHFAPESPVRRGLDHVNISTDGALHNAFFKVLPTKPLYPERIETEVIVEQSERVVDILSKSIAESRKTERKVMSKVVRDGYYLTSGPDTGKSTIPILERARRSYNPSGRTITAGETYRVKPPVSGSQAYGVDTTSSRPKTAGDAEPRTPFTVRDAPDTKPMAMRMDEVTDTPMDMPLPVAEAPALIAAAPGMDGSRPNSAPHEIMAEELVTSSIELSMTSISEQFYQANSGVDGGYGAPAPPSPSMNPLDIQEEEAGYGANPISSLKAEGFHLDAEETFADGYADFTPGYAMASPTKPGEDGDGMGMGGEGKGGDMNTDPNTGKAFNEESMSMVMQSLDLLFPE